MAPLPHAITRLVPADLDACLELAADRGWRPERRKWALLFDFGEVYGIRDPAGGLAGTVALTRYGPDLAIVSMMLVASRLDGRGLGRRLMTHALAQAGDATVVGPLVAPDLEAARALIADVASAIDGPIRLDLHDRHDGLREWAEARGVPPRLDTWLMVHGARELPGARERLVLPVMQALG